MLVVWLFYGRLQHRVRDKLQQQSILTLGCSFRHHGQQSLCGPSVQATTAWPARLPSNGRVQCFFPAWNARHTHAAACQSHIPCISCDTVHLQLAGRVAQRCKPPLSHDRRNLTVCPFDTSVTFTQLYGRVLVLISAIWAPTVLRITVEPGDETLNLHKIVHRNDKGVVIGIDLPDRMVLMANHQVRRRV